MKHKKRIILILSLVFLFALPSLAYAAPTITNVSGALTHGNTITVSGSGFGAKSPAAPVLWAPFDTSLAPSSLGRATSWQYNECVEYTASGRSGGGAKTIDSCGKTATAQLGFNTDTLGLGYYFNTLGQKNYIFRHRRMNYSNDINLKSLEIIGTDYTTNNNWVFNHSTNQWISQQVDPGSYFYMDPSPVVNQWGTEELVMRANVVLGENADVKWYGNGVLLGDSTTDGWFISARGTGGTDMMRIVPVFHGDYNITGGGTLADTPEYWDSVYVDNSWSRVLLGDAATFAASTQREIQIPSAWSDTSLTLTANLGQYTTGTAYLYVVDSAGAVNANGFPVTIGGAPDTTPPIAPSGLGIQ